MPLKSYKTRENMLVPDIILEMESFPTEGRYHHIGGTWPEHTAGTTILVVPVPTTQPVPPFWWYRFPDTATGTTILVVPRPPNTAPVPPYWWYLH